MSDHEAIVFNLNLYSKNTNVRSKHRVAVYHKANLVNIKKDLVEFHNLFFESDPYTKTVEQNWTKFKNAVSNSASKNVPHKTICPSSKLLWINKEIKKGHEEMQTTI